MKPAIFCGFNSTRLNIGEPIQYLTIASIYAKMGIALDEIVMLSIDEIIGYAGEDELLLPITAPIVDFAVNGQIAIPHGITPIFLATYLNTMTRMVDLDIFLSNPFNHNYLLQYSPIGCRDEATYDYLKKHNIPAYINGCLTATLPKIPHLNGKAVVLADAPKALLEYIPLEYLNAETLTTSQQCLIEPSMAKDYRKIFHIGKEKCQFYIDNAKLVITSRLHVALPCAAFGIPVILAKDVMDTRFSFLESYFPVYDRAQYSSIDWHPTPINFEEQKSILTELAISRISNAFKCAGSGAMLTNKFASRANKHSYANSHVATHQNSARAINHIHKNWRAEEITYALWGANENTADFWKETIETAYPRAKLVAIFDRHPYGKLFGLEKLPPEKISDFSNIQIFVCAVGAVDDALKLFGEYNIPSHSYCIVADQFISEKDFK